MMWEEFNITDNKQLCDVETYYNRSQLYVVGRFLCNMSHTLYSKKKNKKNLFTLSLPQHIEILTVPVMSWI